MTDQATTLREMISQTPIEAVLGGTKIYDKNTGAARRPARSIAVTGGKGGVGKSNIAVNLTLELGALKKRVTLLDGDLGLANADLLCGINPEFHLGHFFSRKCSLEQAVVELEENVKLIPGGSGVEELANFSLAHHALLLAELQAIEQTSDFFLIDTAAGIGENVTGILRAAAEIIVVTTPEPTAIIDAYATIKNIFQNMPGKKVWLVVNSVVNLRDAEQVFRQLNSAAERFLNSRLAFLGAIPQDDQLAEAVREQIPVVKFAPICPASRSIRLIARALNEKTEQVPANSAASDESFWSLLSRTEN